MHGFKDGVEFFRTTQHLINVIDEKFELLKEASAKEVDDELLITISANKLSKNMNGDKFKAYAEVWGTENGTKKPIAWVGGMVLAKGEGEKVSCKFLSNNSCFKT
jgi:hypothetical protein